MIIDLLHGAIGQDFTELCMGIPSLQNITTIMDIRTAIKDKLYIREDLSYESLFVPFILHMPLDQGINLKHQ